MSQAVYVQDGVQIDYIPSAAVAAGDVVVQGDLAGVAASAIAANTLGAITVIGVFDVVKGSGTTFTAGAKVYWDDTNNVATNNASGNTFLGLATKAAASGDTTVRVLLSR